MASVLGVPSSVVSDASSQDTLAGWDSLAHIHLLMALEAEFGVSFDPARAVTMTSIAAIEAALAQRSEAAG